MTINTSVLNTLSRLYTFLKYSVHYILERDVEVII